MHGARVRYPVAGLRKWAESLPQFTNRAQAYAAHPQRAKGAARQRAATEKARKAKIAKRAEQAGKAKKYVEQPAELLTPSRNEEGHRRLVSPGGPKGSHKDKTETSTPIED